MAVARPDGGTERGKGDATGPHAGSEEQWPAEAGQLDQRAAGLPEEHTPQRQPAEGP